MPTVALFSFRQAEIFFLGGAEVPPAPLGRTPVAKKYVMNDAPAADDAVTTRNIYLNKSTKKAAVSGNY